MEDLESQREADAMRKQALSLRPVVVGVVFNVIWFLTCKQFKLPWFSYLVLLSLIPTALLFWMKLMMRAQFKAMKDEK